MQNIKEYVIMLKDIYVLAKFGMFDLCKTFADAFLLAGFVYIC